MSLAVAFAPSVCRCCYFLVALRHVVLFCSCLLGTKKPWQPETWQDSALFSHRAFFFTFWGHFLGELHRKPGEKGKKSTGENSKIQWRRHLEIADFCPLSWSNAPWITYKKKFLENYFSTHHGISRYPLRVNKLHLESLILCNWWGWPLHPKRLGKITFSVIT